MRRRQLAAGLLWLGRPAEAAGPHDALLRLVADKAAARIVGRAYLAGLAPAAREPHLIAACLPAVPTRAGLMSRIRDDFCHDRMVSVDGWMLAETEARLCALVALLG